MLSIKNELATARGTESSGGSSTVYTGFGNVSLLSGGVPAPGERWFFVENNTLMRQDAGGKAPAIIDLNLSDLSVVFEPVVGGDAVLGFFFEPMVRVTLESSGEVGTVALTAILAMLNEANGTPFYPYNPQGIGMDPEDHPSYPVLILTPAS